MVHTGFSCKRLCFLYQKLFLFFSHLATKEHVFTLSSPCAEVWRSWVRNDTDKDFWFFCRLNFLWAINLSSLFLFTDEIISPIPLIVCQNYQLTPFWCSKFFFSDGPTHHFENDEHRWVQPILYILFILRSLPHLLELDQICSASRDNSIFYLGFLMKALKILPICRKVHGKWRRSSCHCMSIIHIFHVDRVSCHDPWLLICCINVTSLWPSCVGRHVTSDRCSLGIWFG